MVDTHNLPGGKKKYFCDLCEKDFDTIQDAVSHELHVPLMEKILGLWGEYTESEE